MFDWVDRERFAKIKISLRILPFFKEAANHYEYHYKRIKNEKRRVRG